jgi:phosphatidylglycerol:prolipoprotein diacylglycerol transferase
LTHTGQVSGDVLGSVFGGSGLIWYGGALGGAAGVLGWARRRGMFNLQLLDLCSPALAMGYAVGRIGCQVSGDGDYGKATDVPWGMAYPHGIVPTTDVVHPTPIYETLSMGLVAWALWRARHVLRPGVLFACYLVLAGGERFLVEFLRRNEPVLGGLTEAQLASLVMIVAGTVWLVLAARSGGLRAVSVAAPRPATA